MGLTLLDPALQPGSTVSALPGVQPAGYRSHPLHGRQAIWPEKNCYVDLWIALLHSLGADPHAMLGVTLAVDFEGDQWTFFKPSHDMLWQLYGVDVQELTLWRPLTEHAVEHLGAGKLIALEADAWWLPDTAGTDYRRQHTKTSIVLLEIDLAARRLVYLHNAGCHELHGEDFARIFSLDGLDDGRLPFFAELVRFDRLRRRPPHELRAIALRQLPELLKRRPYDNPVHRFAQRFEQDLPLLRERGLTHYHAWAFGAIREPGAAFELAARWLDWLAPDGPAGLAQAARQFELASAGCKTLILKGARAAASNKPAALGELLDGIAAAWGRGMSMLDDLLVCPRGQTSCRPDRTDEPGAMMGERDGTVRTSIHGQGGGQIAAAAERGGGSRGA